MKVDDVVKAACTLNVSIITDQRAVSKRNGKADYKVHAKWLVISQETPRLPGPIFV